MDFSRSVLFLKLVISRHFKISSILRVAFQRERLSIFENQDAIVFQYRVAFHHLWWTERLLDLLPNHLRLIMYQDVVLGFALRHLCSYHLVQLRVLIEAVAWCVLNTRESDQHGSVKANRLTPAKFFSRLSGQYVGLTLVYPGTGKVQSHLEYVCRLHARVENGSSVVFFRLHVSSHYGCGSRYSENLLPVVGLLSKF